MLDFLHDVRLFQPEDVRFDVGVGCVASSWNNPTIEQENLFLRSLLHCNSIFNYRNFNWDIFDFAIIIDMVIAQLTFSHHRAKCKLYNLRYLLDIAIDILCCSSPCKLDES